MAGKKQRAVLALVLIFAFLGFPTMANAVDATLPVVVADSGVLSATTLKPGETLTFSARITDDVGCCSTLMYQFFSEPGRNINTGPIRSNNYVASPNSKRISGSATDGIYRVDFVVPANFPLGSYYLKIQAIDLSGSYTHLEPIGQVIFVDDELPVLVPDSGTLSSASLFAGDSLTASFRVTDNYGCCTWAGIGIYSLAGQNVNTGEILWRRDQEVTRISGSSTDGRYSYTVQLPSNIAAGTYYVKAQANDIATWYTHLEPVGTLTILAPATGSSPKESESKSSSENIQSSPSENRSSPMLRLKQKIAGKSLATQIGMTVSPKSKVKLKVSKSSKKICKVSGSKLVALKPGNCSVTIAVTPAKTKTVKKPKTTKQSTVVQIS